MPDDFLSDLPDTLGKTISYETGDVLFRQDQRTRGFFSVQNGCVVLQRTTQTGDVLVIHRASAGDSFAEASIFSDVYHCDAICTSDCTFTLFERSMVSELMQNDPAFSMRFARHLAVQVQQYRAHIELLAIRSAPERLLTALQTEYNQGTVTELAKRINLTHETCYRALRQLCQTGQVRQVARGRYELV